MGPPRAEAGDAAEDASLGEAEADFRAGTSGEDPDLRSARSDVQTPNVVQLQVPLKCLEAPGKQRAESCVEQFEITLTRHSERPLSVDLELAVALGGDQPTTPPGRFEVTLEELPP